LIGQQWQPLKDLLARVNDIRKQVQAYRGTLSEKALAITAYCFARAERVHSDEFCKVYLSQAKAKLAPQLRFPLVLGGTTNEYGVPFNPDSFLAAVNLVDRIKRDLDSPSFQAIVSGEKQALVGFRGALSKLDPVINALVTPDKHLRLAAISLMSRGDQFRLSGQQRMGLDLYRGIELRVGTIDHATPVKVGAIGKISTDAPSEFEIAKFTVYEPFHFHLYRMLSDANFVVDMPAPETWTAIRLLGEWAATRSADGTHWQLAINPARGREQARSFRDDKLIWLEFKFDAPVPSFDDWPTAKSLGLAPALRQ
jgi:hypothetical protein